MIREAFRNVLLADATVSTMVDGTRIFPLMMPQGVRKPSLVYQRVGGANDLTMEGPAGIRETVMQVAAWALDPDQAARVIGAAEARLNGYSGLMPWGDDSPQAEADFRLITLDRERDGYDAAAKLYHDSRDFTVMWCPGAA